RNAPGYQELYQDQSIKPGVDIRLRLSSKEVTISDTAGGISATDAENHVFRFGRATEATHVRDRLSVYGIGLKRAMFKLGRVIKIRSGHVQGGFDLNVDVDKWELDPNQPWTFPITKRAPVPATDCGTTIEITRLHEDAVRRLSDGVFAGQLRDRIART